MLIPESEFEFAFSRSSGHGGQNVNKTSTRVQVKWNIGRSGSFSEFEKNLIRKILKNQLTVGDELMVTASDERTQLANRKKAITRLRELVRRSLVRPKNRIRTKPSKIQRLKRLENKTKNSLKKQVRSRISNDYF